MGKGVPFRDAHALIGRLVLYCIEKHTSIDALSLEELRAVSPVFEADLFEAVSLETCVEKRLTTGAPGKKAMRDAIAAGRAFLQEEKKY